MRAFGPATGRRLACIVRRHNSAMSTPTSLRRALDELSQRSPIIALFCLVVSFAVLANGGSVILPGAGALFLVGVLCAALLIYSWWHYRPLLSWLIWAVPGAVLAAGVLEFALRPPFVAGFISILSVFGALFGCGGLGFFGSLLLLRRRLAQWFPA